MLNSIAAAVVIIISKFNLFKLKMHHVISISSPYRLHHHRVSHENLLCFPRFFLLLFCSPEQGAIPVTLFEYTKCINEPTLYGRFEWIRLCLYDTFSTTSRIKVGRTKSRTISKQFECECCKVGANATK